MYIYTSGLGGLFIIFQSEEDAKIERFKDSKLLGRRKLLLGCLKCSTKTEDSPDVRGTLRTYEYNTVFFFSLDTSC